MGFATQIFGQFGILWALVWQFRLQYVESVGYNISRFDFTIYNSYIDDGKHEIPIHARYPSEMISSKSSEQFPLVLFMHGDPCEWWWYEYLANFLVPKGYIVCLIASEEPAGSPNKMALDMKYSLDYILNMSLYNQSYPKYVIHYMHNL